MKDIVKAIEAEQEYLKEKIKGTHPNIHDYLDTWGYSDLEEFQLDKKSNELKQLEWVVYVLPKLSLSPIQEYVKNKQAVFAYCINTGEKAAHVKKDDERIPKLEMLGYRVFEVGVPNLEDGLIITHDGDLRVCVSLPTELNVTQEWFLTKLCRFFNSLGLTSVIDNNDILINDRKVCGCGSFVSNDMINIVFQISFTDHIDEIETICGIKPKKPGFIDNSILTPEQMKDEFLSWVSNKQ